MKHVLLSVLLTASAMAATAPDSIAGKTLHEAHQQRTGPVISRGESTIVFGTDGRFVYLKNAPGATLLVPQPEKIGLQAPRADGTYTYARTSDTDAVILLTDDNGQLGSVSLQFTSATEGQSVFATLQQTFWLTDTAALATAPATNISVRGRASPGRPVILGFVVPGTRMASAAFPPPVGSAQREVLIRAVGPSLTPLGVTDVWSDPDFRVFSGATTAFLEEAHYGDWSATPPAMSSAFNPTAALQKIFGFTGAFPLTVGAKDAADVVRLAPGAYTVVCEPPASDPGGEVLIEVYFLP